MLKKIGFNRLNIGTRLIISISSLIALVITIICCTIACKVQEMAENSAKTIAEETAYRYATQVKAELEVALDEARAIARLMQAHLHRMQESNLNRKQVNLMLKGFIEHSPEFLGVYVLFEPNAFDGRDAEFVNTVGHDNTGRFIPYWTRDSKGEGVLEAIIDYETSSSTGDFYQLPKKNKKDSITEPYTYPVQGKDILMTSLTIPIFDSAGNFAGIAGIDLALNDFQNLVKEIRIPGFDNAFINFYSPQGVIVASQKKPQALGKSVRTVSDSQELINNILKNKPFFVKRMSTAAQEMVITYGAPVEIDHTDNYWMVVVNIHQDELFAESILLVWLIAMIGIIAILVSVVTIALLAKRLVRPILDINVAARKLSQGEWNYPLPTERQDELGDLAKSFHYMAEQLREAFNTLEAKVTERTSQLADANQAIIKLNQQLQVENQRMGTELEIARQLQQMVLPKAHELNKVDGLDIAGFMEPATEIGGDYYDVLQHDGRVKIGIGDVTGHGLESGVLMLMVQTAVRTLLSNNVTDPKAFLNVLNRAIYENVRRMDSDKNLTLSLIDYHKGILSLSGQHEEVLVVRDGGKVERIDTIELGFMVGLEPDIAAFVSKLEIFLGPNDGIVLYTDGITEAHNTLRQPYGVERLCYVVGCHWQSPAIEIQQAVISDLREHIGKQKLQDDITLLILKQR